MKKFDIVVVASKLISQRAAQIWGNCDLCELGDWATTTDFPLEHQGNTDMPYLMCKISDMNLMGNEIYVQSTVNTFDNTIAKKIGAKIHPKGTVVFPKRGGAIATNKRRILEHPTAIDTNMLGIIPNKGILPKWLYFLLRGIDFSKFQSGTSVPAINQKDLVKIKVPSIPLDAQQAICDFLTELESNPNRKSELSKLPIAFDEQSRILAHIEALATRITSISSIRSAQTIAIQSLLASAFSKVIENGRWLPMREVAPLIRRPIKIDADTEYPELGIRSFGRGTFHKVAISGALLGTKRLFRIEPGDLVFNNVFAWEGAVAVARNEDVDRFGSHRFITCLPTNKVATSNFLCFYFLTREGLEKLGTASPGGAGRNRTLGLNALENILVPVPEYEKQVWFDSVQARLASLRELQSATGEELSALLPSVLDRAFKGEL